MKPLQARGVGLVGGELWRSASMVEYGGGWSKVMHSGAGRA